MLLFDLTFVAAVLPRGKDVGELRAFKGTVVRTGAPKLLEWTRHYRCTQCDHEFEQIANLSLANDFFPPPIRCPSENIPECTSRKFLALELVLRNVSSYQTILSLDDRRSKTTKIIKKSVYRNTCTRWELVPFRDR